MDELFKKLLEADVLTEDTKAELEAAFKAKLNEAVEAARTEATAEVTRELTENWIKDRDTLIEALDSKVTQAVSEEMEELRESIEQFRDLEAEKAQELVEAKQQMAETLKKDISRLIEELDTFLEIRLMEEFEELHESIEVVKQRKFGQTVFEAFIDEFKKHYAPEGSTEAKLNEAEQQLAEARAELEEAQKKAADLERSIQLEKVLAPLSGRTKEVMEAILKTVPTDRLEESYTTYIGRVLKETAAPAVKTSEKEQEVLAEGKEEVRGVVKTGDDVEQQQEQRVVEQAETRASKSQLSESTKLYFRRMGGVQA